MLLVESFIGLINELMHSWE